MVEDGGSECKRSHSGAASRNAAGTSVPSSGDTPELQHFFRILIREFLFCLCLFVFFYFLFFSFFIFIVLFYLFFCFFTIKSRNGPYISP